MDDIAFAILIVGMLFACELSDFMDIKKGYTKEEIKKINEEAGGVWWFLIIVFTLVIYLTK